jgi:hypothetical protein
MIEPIPFQAIFHCGGDGVCLILPISMFCQTRVALAHNDRERETAERCASVPLGAALAIIGHLSSLGKGYATTQTMQRGTIFHGLFLKFYYGVCRVSQRYLEEHNVFLNLTR